MSKKYLGKVAFGGALASAALFVAAPGIASASVTPSTWGGDHKEEHGYVKTFPKWVHPGDELKIIEVCSEEQEYAKVWSKATGKVALEPWRPHDMADDAGSDERWGQDKPDGGQNKADRGQDKAAGGQDGGSWWREDGQTHGKYYENGKGDEHADENGKGDHGKGDHGKEHYVYVGGAYVYENTDPGWYKVRGECGYGKIEVVRVRPEGPVAGGDGGVTGANTNLAAGGAAALATAAFGGVFMVRRRRTDGAQI